MDLKTSYGIWRLVIYLNQVAWRFLPKPDLRQKFECELFSWQVQKALVREIGKGCREDKEDSKMRAVKPTTSVGIEM